MIPNAEGFTKYDANALAYKDNYILRDHLGNTRVVFQDKNGDGIIDPISEVVQVNAYYPFGMNHGANINGANGAYKYQYNGKEFDDDLGLNWNDYGARFYDPAIGRWNSTDRLSEVYLSYSPYHYVMNNPIALTDPSGMASIRHQATGSIVGSVDATGSDVSGGTGTGFRTAGAEEGCCGFMLRPLGMNPPGKTLKTLDNLTYGIGRGTADLFGNLDKLPRAFLNLAKLASTNVDVRLNAMGSLMASLTKSYENFENEDNAGREIMFGQGLSSILIWEAAVETSSVTFAAANGAYTTSEGFLFGSITMKAPFDINVGLYASDASLYNNAFRYSTIAPKSFFETNYFGRKMLQIRPEWQDPLGPFTSTFIPKGTPFKLGLVGPQKGLGIGIPYFQFYTPSFPQLKY